MHRAIFMFCETFQMWWIFLLTHNNLEWSLVDFPPHRGSSAAKILKTSNLIGIQKFDWFNQSWQRCNKLRPGDHKEPLWASPNKISCFQLWKTQLVGFNGITLSISTPILRPYKSSSGGHGHDPLNGRDIFTFFKVLVKLIWKSWAEMRENLVFFDVPTHSLSKRKIYIGPQIMSQEK